MDTENILELPEEQILAFLDHVVDEETLRIMERRYAHENELLSAVSTGDLRTALSINFTDYEGSLERYHGSLTANKQGLYTLNTLLRKAVEQADVHPAHIDHVSHTFAKVIRQAETVTELESLSDDMIRKYCLLVQNYSLKGYSVNVQNALNYIDFHLTEPLTLSYVAEKISVNRKYLSSQFKREYGSNITDYINEKRIRESLQYLALTTLSVQEIGERVGILDINYYSRVFKKIMNLTPSAYRKMMRS